MGEQTQEKEEEEEEEVVVLHQNRLGQNVTFNPESFNSSADQIGQFCFSFMP